jgi:hypothetical protein
MEIFGLNLLKSFIIITLIILYWKFVYYKYHKNIITPLSFVVYSAIIGGIGFYEVIKGTIKFSDISLMFIIFSIWGLFSFFLVFVGWKKHGLIKKVDITLTFINKYFGRIFVYLAMIISFPVFYFDMAGSYYVFGKEYIIFWILILGAWIVSNIRLIRRAIIQ